MSEFNVKSISSGTDTFASSRKARNDEPASIIGNVAPNAGKNLPVEKPAKPDVEAIAQKLNSVTQSIGRDLRFQVNLDTGKSVIHVLDRETGEIIREIPPEEASLLDSSITATSLRLYDDVV